MSLTVRVAGRLLGEIGPHSPPVYETLADGGTGDASWRMLPQFGRVRWGFLEGARAAIEESGLQVWLGTIEEIDRIEGGVTCRGRWFDGDFIPALTTASALTNLAVAAVQGAQSFGWAMSRGGVEGTVVGELNDPPTITEFLRMLADQLGQRVGVNARGGSYLYMRADPTVPKWVVTAHGVELSGTDRGRVNAVKGRYVDSTGALKTATRPAVLPSPVSIKTVDLTDRGVLTKSQAETILTAVLTKMRDRPRWVNALSVPLRQIQTLGGGALTSPVNIVGGDMVRILSLTAAQREQVGGGHLDVVLGKVVIDGASDVVYLEPIDATPQSFEDAFEEAVA